jgi:hypothetical protein
MQWIDGVVIGMENMTQLTENIDYFDSQPLIQSQIDGIKSTQPRLGESTLNPASWRKTIQ